MRRGLASSVVADWCAPFYLACCLVFGGASAAGFIANAALQVLALILIGIILGSGRVSRIAGAATLPLWLLGGTALVIAVQLIPLPQALWSQLPGRAPVLHLFGLAKVAPPWLPISLAPDATIAALLALLPPTAMLLAVQASSERGRARSIRAVIAVAALALAIGAVQRLGSPESPLYFYETTNRGSAVGFFANRNHLGTLLLCALPLLTALDPGEARRRTIRTLAIAVAAGAIAIGIVMVGSVAAIAMMPPTLLLCAILLLRARASPLRWRWLVPATLVTALLASGAATVLHRDADVPSAASQHRVVIIPTALRAAWAYAPLGSGGGSFALVYPFYEDREAATPEFVNHAHCDYAEVALEYGAPGLLLIVAAIVLWATRIVPVWRLDGLTGARARAALAALAIMAIASGVDYPLRTAALAALAGAAMALLIPLRRWAPPDTPRTPDRGQSVRVSLVADKI